MIFSETGRIRPADQQKGTSHRRDAMDRIENGTAHESKSVRPILDEELEAVTGGVMVALGVPDTRQQADHSCWIRVSHPYAGA
jgi:hypothetical protein